MRGNSSLYIVWLKPNLYRNHLFSYIREWPCIIKVYKFALRVQIRDGKYIVLYSIRIYLQYSLYMIWFFITKSRIFFEFIIHTVYTLFDLLIDTAHTLFDFVVHIVFTSFCFTHRYYTYLVWVCCPYSINLIGIYCLYCSIYSFILSSYKCFLM